MKLKRLITISPAYDKRSDDPKKDYGIGSCRIFFVVIGKKGAVSVNFFTNWFLPSTIKEYRDEGIHRLQFESPMSGEPFKTKIDLEKENKPIHGGSWDYHSRKKRNEYEVFNKICEFTGGRCYSDGSCLKADDYLTLLLERGSDAVFDKLEKDYKKEFENV